MKRLTLIVSIITAALIANPVWSANDAKPKREKPTRTSTAKAKAKTLKPKVVITKAPVEIPVSPQTQTTTATPEPAIAVAMSVTETAQNPSTPSAPVAVNAILVPVPVLIRNPYLQPAPALPAPYQPPGAFLSPFVYPQGGSWIAVPTYGQNVTTPGVVIPSLNDIGTFAKSFAPLSALLQGGSGESHWPISFTRVFPTGEKPLVVLTIKCPTEAAFGIAPPPVKLIHIILTAGMDSINATGILPFNLEQVCQ